MIIEIKDYILRKRTEHRMKRLADLFELTPEETEALIQTATRPLPEPDEFPFDMEMPDGEIVKNREEMEEWYARHGERI